ncbi:MAG: helicase-related protein [Lacrimispora saccharolytica]
MDNQTIVSKMNSYLHESAAALVTWLEGILPKVDDTWWDDCVLNSLSYTQREIAITKAFSKLSDFNLAALLRIANKSWYDMRTVAYLPSSEREVIREMMTVRNNWAHCSAELPGKDVVLNDLHTISTLISQLGGDKSILKDISEFIEYVERPDSIKINVQSIKEETSSTQASSSMSDGIIRENSLVCLVGYPEVRGVVHAIKNIGSVKKYDVFVNGKLNSYYTGQIELVEESVGYDWVSVSTVRSYLTAYQINNPSSHNLYSLNSARIDFIPYQFRPALKMIHADEPRILIADSVGVGKTIEAGLIIKELEARTELEKIVVICPRPLVAERKWENEMKRFDEEFIPVDSATLRQIVSDTDRDGEWPVRYNKVIIPYSIMDSRLYNGDDQKRTRSFGLSELDPEPHFDLVIVDEAHHIRNGSMDKEKAFAYKCTKYFCDHADAVVMLTATPLQTRDDDLFTLLNVLRPDIVIDQKTFEMMARPNEYISRAVRFIRAAEESWAEAAVNELLGVRRTQWGDNVIAENPLYDDIMIRLEKSEITREERVKLISDIESLHSFATMINRTRRRDIQDFCVRRSHTISTEFSEYQQRLHDELLSFEKAALAILHDPRSVAFMMSTIKRQAASCIFGLAPHIRDIIARRVRQLNDDPDIEFGGFNMDGSSGDAISSLAASILSMADNLPPEDPKLEETLKIIELKQEMPNNKIMLFSTFRHTLAYLKKKLTELGYRVEQVDGGVKDEQRYAFKARFELPKEDPDSIDILLFTEVGSEGLDYQFCDMMINYDLPWNPMRIEQRIGRIDRRGQKSEAVNIYNVITENTIDAEIYYRCLMRIGIFENSIGECEEILGEIATGIEGIILDSSLTDDERKRKLEQIADNEVRKLQEITRLEEEEKELFGFDLTEFTTAQEIRHAENPWLTPQGLQGLIEQYLKEILGDGVYILGDGAMKNLRLNASARGILKDELRKMPGSRNALRRTWENYLSGKKPNHTITFDADAASKDRDSFFITAMHPLAKQAAEHFAKGEAVYLKLQHYSNTIPAGNYPFSVYAWRFTGFNEYTRLVTICESEQVAEELPDVLENASNSPISETMSCDWSDLEGLQVARWMDARTKHKRDVTTTITFKLESLANNQRNRIRSLEQQIQDAFDDSIRRMKMSELETVQENYSRKVNEIQSLAAKADIYTTLLVNGIITVMEG